MKIRASLNVLGVGDIKAVILESRARYFNLTRILIKVRIYIKSGKLLLVIFGWVYGKLK